MSTIVVQFAILLGSWLLVVCVFKPSLDNRLQRVIVLTLTSLLLQLIISLLGVVGVVISFIISLGVLKVALRTDTFGAFLYSVVFNLLSAYVFLGATAGGWFI